MRLYAAAVPTMLIFLLATTETLAQGALRIPNGYRIVDISPVSLKNQYAEAKGNSHVPLFNATLACWTKYYGNWDTYIMRGLEWDGVTEQMIKRAASKGGLMTNWDFQSWGDEKCNLYGNGTKASTKQVPGWYVVVSLPSRSMCSSYLRTRIVKRDRDELLISSAV
jgi:hypothetical protein